MEKEDGEAEMGVGELFIMFDWGWRMREVESGRCRACFVESERVAKGRRWVLSSLVVLQLIAGSSSRLYRSSKSIQKRSSEVYEAKPCLSLAS